MDRAILSTGAQLPSALAQAHVTRLPATAYYVPDFISEEEERILLDKASLITTCLDLLGRYGQWLG